MKSELRMGWEFQFTVNYPFNTSQYQFFFVLKTPPPSLFKHNKSGKYAAPRRNSIKSFRLRSRISPVSSIINATEAPAAGRGWLMSSSLPSLLRPSFLPSLRGGGSASSRQRSASLSSSSSSSGGLKDFDAQADRGQRAEGATFAQPSLRTLCHYDSASEQTDGIIRKKERE